MQTEKLTLAQLSGYLAYGLKVIYNSDNSEREMLLLDTTRDDYSHIFKPIVIPLDRLTEAQWIEVFKAGIGAFAQTENTAFFVEQGKGFITTTYFQNHDRTTHPLPKIHRFS